MKGLIVGAVKTMSSLEVAELTGKNHADVLRDIRNVLLDAEIDESIFAGIYLDAYKREKPCFNLPYRETQLIISGYSVKHRLAIIDRWQELEAMPAAHQLPDFNNPVAAARAWADAKESEQAALQAVERKNQLLITSNTGNIQAGDVLVRQFVKHYDFIDLGEHQFYDWMRQQRYIMQTNEPYGRYVNKARYFVWKPSKEAHGGKYRYTLMITPKGQLWLANQYLKFSNGTLAA